MSTTKLRLRCSHEVYGLRGFSVLCPGLRCPVCGKQTFFPFLTDRSAPPPTQTTQQTQLPPVQQSTSAPPPSPSQGAPQYAAVQRMPLQQQFHSQQAGPMVAPRHLEGWVGRSSQIVNFWEYCHFIGLVSVKLGLSYVLDGMSPIIAYVLLFFSAGSGLRVAWKMLEVYRRTHRVIYRSEGFMFDKAQSPILESRWGIIRRQSATEEMSRTISIEIDRRIPYRLLGCEIGDVRIRMQGLDGGMKVLILRALPHSEKFKEGFLKDIALYRFPKSFVPSASTS